MPSVKTIEEKIGIVLILGTLFSALLVIIGGAAYLLQHGSEIMRPTQLQTSAYRTDVQLIWHQAKGFSPLGIIELGLLALIATQILRVALLTYFYAIIRDYWFTFICSFVLIILINSLFWR